MEGSEQRSLMQTNTGEMGYENVINMILHVNVNIYVINMNVISVLYLLVSPEEVRQLHKMILEDPCPLNSSDPLVLASAAPPRSYFRGAS